jgi:DNA-directed RNA polymerase specialized sigma24 family protein
MLSQNGKNKKKLTKKQLLRKKAFNRYLNARRPFVDIKKESNDLQKTVTKYQYIIDWLLIATFCGYYKKELPNKKYPSWIYSLYNKILSLHKSDVISCSVDIDDFRQIILLTWAKHIPLYFKNKPKVGFKKYLVRFTKWALTKEVKRLLKTGNKELEWKDSQEEEKDFSLDIEFLLDKSNLYPLTQLSPFQRELIFLQYRHEYRTIDLLKTLQKNRKTIDKQYIKIDNIFTDYKMNSQY